MSKPLILKVKEKDTIIKCLQADNSSTYIDGITKADAYTSCNIKTNVKTAVTGVVPTTLVNYTDGGASVSVRGDTYSGNYEFKARIFI